MGDTKKRRDKGIGSIRQRSDKLWEGRLVVGRDPADGKQKRISIYGSTKTEVRKRLTSIAAEVEKGTYLQPCKMTLGAWLDSWLSVYTLKIKEQTKVQYGQICRVHLKPNLGAVPLAELKPSMIQELYAKLVKDGKSGKTIKNINGVLHKALDQAVSNDLILKNPCSKDKVDLPKVVKPDVCPLTEQQTVAFLKAIKDTDYNDILRVDLFTGMRQAEIMGLTWDRVDFEKGTILVDRQLMYDRVNKCFKFAGTKTDKPRTLKPAPFVMNILRERRKKQLEDKLKAGSLWNSDGFPNLVFTNPFGGHYHQTTLTHAVTRIGKTIGIEGLHFHSLRHTYAVSCIRAGDDMKTVSSNLGHSTIQITMDLYAHFTDDMRDDSSNRMEEYAKRFNIG